MCSPPTERPRSLMRFSRGFKERTPALAVKHGHKHILPDYPAHVLFDELYMALSAAGTGGDIPAIELLWQLAGPTSPGRLAWAEEIGLISEAMIHGHIPVLDWIADAVSATGIPINWKSQSMGSASVAGRTDAIHWAIVHKRIRNLPYWAAMLSTRENDVSVMDWWIAKQPDNDMAIWEMGSTMTLSAATSAGAVRALDWWWAYTGPQTLPDPQSFADIVDAALISICTRALGSDARKAQLWLRDRLDLFAPESDIERQQFLDKCISELSKALLFSLDFVGIFFPGLNSSLPVPQHAYCWMTPLLWFCHRSNVTVVSLLPLGPDLVHHLLNSSNGIMAEWWLQAHIAGDHAFVLPTAGKLDEIYQVDEGMHRWMYDVTATRKIAVFAKSEDGGIVPYTSPPFPVPEDDDSDASDDDGDSDASDD
ncbi:hypothetical protein BC828DRAFT_413947 [Blastocladiella britannica]|nr:hypothetical protein BC828DRAFT_413947 [Blastocladiella britannica]